MHAFTFVAGLICVFAALLDAFQTVILPRRATGRFRLTRLFYVFTWTPWSAIASRIKHPRKRETALSFYGPLSLVFLIVAWAAALVFGFSLMYYGLGSHFTDSLGVKADLAHRLVCERYDAVHARPGGRGSAQSLDAGDDHSGVRHGAGVCGRGDRLLSGAVWGIFAAGGQYFASRRARRIAAHGGRAASPAHV